MINNKLQSDDPIEEMIEHTRNILTLWLVKDNKPAVLLYYSTLSSIQQPMLLNALTTVIGACNDPIVAKAGIDIPIFIREKQANATKYN